jgi:pimeloyl-ACP methyl ester carboxylesterase
MGVRHGGRPAKVIALHGWMRTHADFDVVLAGLDAVAPDLPGFGASAPPPVPWGAAEYAEALIPVLEEEEPPVALVGHSFGGRVAVMLAATRPDLVRGLILSGVPLLRPTGTTAPKPALAFRAVKALNRIGLLSDARMEERRQRSGPPDYRAVTGVMRDVFVRVVNETSDGTYRRALAAIECPIELVWGENDTAAPLAVAAEAKAVAPGAKLTSLGHVGHLVPTEAPGELRAAIDRQLA